MVTHSDSEDWDAQRARIIGLGDRLFRKSYFPQLQENIEHLKRFRTLLDQTTDFVILFALPEGVITDTNASLARFIEQPPADLVGKPLSEIGLIKPSVIAELNQDRAMEPDAVTGRSHSIIVRNPFDKLEAQWLEIAYRFARVDDSFYGVMVGRDVTDRVHSRDIVETLLAEKEALLENALVGIMRVKERRIQSCNSRLAQMFGYTPSQLSGQSTRILFETQEAYELFGEQAYLALGSGGPFIATMKLIRSDGSSYWCELGGKAIDSTNPNGGSVWILSDVSERKSAEDRARFLSYHDALTGLANHQLFQDRIQQAIALCTRLGTQCAVVTIDIDRFKSYNDFLGYEGVIACLWRLRTG